MKSPGHGTRNRIIAGSAFLLLMLVALAAEPVGTFGSAIFPVLGMALFLAVLFLIERALRIRDAETTLWAFQTVVVIGLLLGTIVLIGKLAE
jgi:hypothetical protein